MIPLRAVLSRDSLFRPPPAELYRSGQGPGGTAYSANNYLRGGLIPRFRRLRFEVALELVRDRFGQGGAVDLGCADGILIPSLAARFDRVAALDVNRGLIDVCTDLVERMELDHVDVAWDPHWGPDRLREVLGGGGFRTAFVLETLEHVGTPGEPLYEPKVRLLEGLFAAMEPDAQVVVTVPKMTGIPLLAKYGIQTVMGMHHEHLSVGELLRAGVLRDTRGLEDRWRYGHVGFNERTLEDHLRERFRVVRKIDLAFSVALLLGNRGVAGG